MRFTANGSTYLSRQELGISRNASFAHSVQLDNMVHQWLIFSRIRREPEPTTNQTVSNRFRAPTVIDLRFTARRLVASSVSLLLAIVQDRNTISDKCIGHRVLDEGKIGGQALETRLVVVLQESASRNTAILVVLLRLMNVLGNESNVAGCRSTGD